MLRAVPPADVTARVCVQETLQSLGETESKELEDQGHVTVGGETQVFVPEERLINVTQLAWQQILTFVFL